MNIENKINFTRERIYSARLIFKPLLIVFALIIILLFSVAPVSALDLSKKYAQKAGADFFASLQMRPSEPRAIFIDAEEEKDPVILYAMFSETGRKLYFFGKLLPDVEKNISSDFVKRSLLDRFRTKRRDGSLFYERGNCLSAFLELSSRLKLAAVYVPYSDGVKISASAERKEPAAFISDRGYIEISCSYDAFVEGGKSGERFPELLNLIFKSAKLKLSLTVEYNRYYFDRPDMFGFVNPLLSMREDKIGAPLFLSHKMTQNRRISDNSEKALRDARDAVRYISADYPLISQDMRVKIGAVEAGVNLDLNEPGQTDIGSGQNTFVYLSYGPGINYYDAPYGSLGQAEMSPRFIFSGDLLNLRDAQFYPKNSWETRGTGIARYDEINAFQSDILTSGEFPETFVRFVAPVYMALNARDIYLEKMTSALLRYGLANDTRELLMDFDFAGVAHRGNPVNNEVRVSGAVYPAYSSRAMIVPAGRKKKYLELFEEELRKAKVSRFPGGTYYRDYFIEAACAGEAGMRAAYIEYLLFSTDPCLFGAVKAAREEGRYGAYLLTARAAAGIIEKEGMAFFESGRVKARRSELSKCAEAYYDYLEALREGRSKSRITQLFDRFVQTYNVSNSGNSKIELKARPDDKR